MYEEEKRLCYVAMTRAKTELVMSWRQEVPVFTADGSRTVTKKRSRFLDVLLSKEQGSSYGKIDKSAKSPEQAQLARSRSSNALSRDSGNSQTISGTKYGTVPFEGRRVSPSPPPPMQAQNTKKLTGTASVYARTLQSPFVAMAKAPLTPKIPPNTTSRPSKASESSYLPSQHVTSALSQRKEALSSQNVIEPQSIDSTWFFPVGSKVSHQQLGIGIVLPPLPPGKDGEMAVFVKFCNGEQREFPVHTADLSPIVI